MPAWLFTVNYDLHDTTPNKYVHVQNGQKTGLFLKVCNPYDNDSVPYVKLSRGQLHTLNQMV